MGRLGKLWEELWEARKKFLYKKWIQKNNYYFMKNN